MAPTLSNAAIVSVKDQKISPQTLLEGLRIWDVASWDWQVVQLSEFDFSVVFPSKDCLRMIASCTSFTLPLNQLVVSVKAAASNGTAVGPLSQVWVLIEDLPASLCSSVFLMSFGVLIGKPIEVDEESLNKVGPARMKVWCVVPDRVHGFIDVYPSPNGIRLRVRVEGAAAAFHAPPPPYSC